VAGRVMPVSKAAVRGGVAAADAVRCSEGGPGGPPGAPGGCQPALFLVPGWPPHAAVVVPTRTHSVMRTLPTCSRAEPTSERCKSCSATPTWRRRRSIPM
jgi:hypothetical protein